MAPSPPTPTGPRGPLPEAGVVYVGVVAATALVTFGASMLPGLEGYEQLILAALFLYTAMHLARREPDGMRRFGIDLEGLLEPPDRDDPRPAGPLGIYDLGRALRRAVPSALRETGVALLVAAIIFPPFFFGFRAWHFEVLGRAAQDFHFAFDITEDWELILTQVLVVALPEEAFFRGYLQTRLHDRWPPKTKVLGVELDLRVWLLQAALFAVLHFVSIPHPARLAVFFPALVFGLLRQWRGGIGAAMAFHAMSNVLAIVLERGYLS